MYRRLLERSSKISREKGKGVVVPPSLIKDLAKKAKSLGLEVVDEYSETKGGEVITARLYIPFEDGQNVVMIDSTYFKSENQLAGSITLNFPAKSYFPWYEVKNLRDLERFGEEYDERGEFHRKVAQFIDYLVKKLQKEGIR